MPARGLQSGSPPLSRSHQQMNQCLDQFEMTVDSPQAGSVHFSLGTVTGYESVWSRRDYKYKVTSNIQVTWTRHSIQLFTSFYQECLLMALTSYQVTKRTMSSSYLKTVLYFSVVLQYACSCSLINNKMTRCLDVHL